MLEGLLLQMDSGMEGGDNPPVEPAPDTSVPVTEPTAPEPTPATEPPATPTPTETPVETPTEPTPATPVVAPDHQAQQKLAWYEANYGNLLEQNKATQEQLRVLETSSMTEDEKARYEIEVGRKEVEDNREQLAQITYAQQLHQYYNQFVPPNVIKGNSPSDWQHSVLTHQTGEIQRLTAEVAALKAAVKPGPNAPKVTTGAPQGASPKRTVYDMTREERAQLAENAAQGLTTKDSYLPVE